MKLHHILYAGLALSAGSLVSCVDGYYAGAVVSGPTPVYRPGYVVDRLPPQYVTETYSGVRYYSHNGVYYRPQGRRYIVVERPHGPSRTTVRRHGNHVDVIRRLPGGYRTVNHRGVRYYEARGQYYRSVPGGYTVVRRPW